MQNPSEDRLPYVIRRPRSVTLFQEDFARLNLRVSAVAAEFKALSYEDKLQHLLDLNNDKVLGLARVGISRGLIEQAGRAYPDKFQYIIENGGDFIIAFIEGECHNEGPNLTFEKLVKLAAEHTGIFDCFARYQRGVFTLIGGKVKAFADLIIFAKNSLGNSDALEFVLKNANDINKLPIKLINFSEGKINFLKYVFTNGLQEGLIALAEMRQDMSAARYISFEDLRSIAIEDVERLKYLLRSYKGMIALMSMENPISLNHLKEHRELVLILDYHEQVERLLALLGGEVNRVNVMFMKFIIDNNLTEALFSLTVELNPRSNEPYIELGRLMVMDRSMSQCFLSYYKGVQSLMDMENPIGLDALIALGMENFSLMLCLVEYGINVKKLLADKLPVSVNFEDLLLLGRFKLNMLQLLIGKLDAVNEVTTAGYIPFDKLMNYARSKFEAMDYALGHHKGMLALAESEPRLDFDKLMELYDKNKDKYYCALKYFSIEERNMEISYGQFTDLYDYGCGMLKYVVNKVGQGEAAMQRAESSILYNSPMGLFKAERELYIKNIDGYLLEKILFSNEANFLKKEEVYFCFEGGEVVHKYGMEMVVTLYHTWPEFGLILFYRDEVAHLIGEEELEVSFNDIVAIGTVDVPVVMNILHNFNQTLALLGRNTIDEVAEFYNKDGYVAIRKGNVYFFSEEVPPVEKTKFVQIPSRAEVIKQSQSNSQFIRIRSMVDDGAVIRVNDGANEFSGGFVTEASKTIEGVSAAVSPGFSSFMSAAVYRVANNISQSLDYVAGIGLSDPSSSTSLSKRISFAEPKVFTAYHYNEESVVFNKESIANLRSRQGDSYVDEFRSQGRQQRFGLEFNR